MTGQRITAVSWADVRQRLSERIPAGATVWGVPTGGSVVAALSGRMVDSPEAADVILDDLIDSGATAARFAHFGKPFIGLWDKRTIDSGVGWIQFPWEHGSDPEDAVARVLQWLGYDTANAAIAGIPHGVLEVLRIFART